MYARRCSSGVWCKIKNNDNNEHHFRWWIVESWSLFSTQNSRIDGTFMHLCMEWLHGESEKEGKWRSDEMQTTTAKMRKKEPTSTEPYLLLIRFRKYPKIERAIERVCVCTILKTIPDTMHDNRENAMCGLLIKNWTKNNGVYAHTHTDRHTHSIGIELCINKALCNQIERRIKQQHQKNEKRNNRHRAHRRIEYSLSHVGGKSIEFFLIRLQSKHYLPLKMPWRLFSFVVHCCRRGRRHRLPFVPPNFTRI